MDSAMELQSMDEVNSSLFAAVEKAKLSINPPENKIVIKNHQACQISIVEISSAGLKFLYIFKVLPTGKREVLHRSIQNFYKPILVENCYDVDFVIHSKLLKISFLDCSKSQISIRGGIINSVELIRCQNLIVDTRQNEIPILQIDLSISITIYQRLKYAVYVLHSSFDVKAAKVPVPQGKSPEYINLDTSLANGEQNFYISGPNMEIARTMPALNDISHNFLFLGEM